MRITAIMIVFLILLWAVSDINDACGNDMTCRTEMEAPQ